MFMYNFVKVNIGINQFLYHVKNIVTVFKKRFKRMFYNIYKKMNTHEEYCNTYVNVLTRFVIMIINVTILNCRLRFIFIV